MSTEKSLDLTQNDIIKPKSNRKIYQRDDFFKYYYCTAEIPDYLKDFQFLHNNFSEENWCKRPLPKFVEITESKGKSVYTKPKVRQRTLSNQSGEYEYQENYNRQRNYTSNGKYNRFATSPNDMISNEEFKMDTKFINSNDFQDNPETQWHKVETRTNRFNNASKPYSQNIQVTENHWKKWTKDTNSTIDKTHRQQQNSFNRPVSTWSRKSESEINPKNPKIFGRHNVLKSEDQTEDIWQDDWDTEMKSEIAKDELELNLDSYEFPKSSILSTTPPLLEADVKPSESLFEPLVESPQFDLWFYRDLSNIERGPFPSEDMANWLATGYFNPTTFVRRSCDEKFLLLAEYRALYGRIPFTAGPTVAPIYLNTPIKLELNQILIGVENNFRQEVINCAVSLSHISHRVEENINVSPNAIIEEKRLLDESRAELEREKERMIHEQIQWRLRVEADLRASMNAELNAKIAEMMKQPINITQHVESADQVILDDNIINESEQSSIDVINEIVENLPEVHDIDICPVVLEPKLEPVVDKWEIDESNIEQILNVTDESNKWFSSKEAKIQKKNKKTKAKENNKTVKEEKKITPIPEAKPPEQPTDSRLLIIPRDSVITATGKENDNISKVRPIRIELENRKSDSPSIWGPVKTTPTAISTSFIQIQAEESIKMKKEKKSNEPEIQPTVVRNTSPKETCKVEQVKSIWNAAPQAQKSPNQMGTENKLSDSSVVMKDSDKSIKEQLPTLKESQLKVKVDGTVKPKIVEVGNRKNKQSKSTNLSESNKIPLFTEKEKSIKNDMPALIKPPVIATKSLLQIQAEETLKEKIAKEQHEVLKKLELSNETSQNKTETPSTWKSGQTLSQNVSPAAKSLVEIQAEEALKAKKTKEIEKAMKVNQIETNKVTSFKESLLKQTSKPAQIPVGKSIWDMIPSDVPVHNKVVVPAAVVTAECNSKPQNHKINEPSINPVHRQQQRQHQAPVASNYKQEIGSVDQLTKWCLKRLAKFSEEFELNTVIELLKEVPNEEVMEMAIQLLGDSKFTCNFVLEFIAKRQELSDYQAADTWQTVKKPIPTPPPAVNNSKTKSGKSRSKKKMVVIEAKFR